MNAIWNSELKKYTKFTFRIFDKVKQHYLLNTEDKILLYWIGRI